MKTPCLIALAATLSGCATSAPGMEFVTPKAIRMPQPEDWRAVRIADVEHVIKLNCEPREGSDVEAERLGINVYRLCISPRTDRGVLGSVVEYFSGPTDEQLVALDWLAQAVATYDGPGLVAWHCTHGCDRTGLFASMVVMYRYGWTFDQAHGYLLASAGGCWNRLPGLYRARLRWYETIYAMNKKHNN